MCASSINEWKLLIILVSLQTMLSSLKRFLNEFNDCFTSEMLDYTAGSDYATLFHQPVGRILYTNTFIEYFDDKCVYESMYVCIS